MSYSSGISFIGGGNMACAIIDAILNSKLIPASELSVFDPSEEKQAQLRNKGVNVLSSNDQIISRDDVLFLAVKPQVMDSVLSSISGKVKSKCIVSIAAGISVDHSKSFLGEDVPIIRTLPNTPRLVLNGMTVVAESSDVSEEMFSFVLSIFKSAGEVVVLPEDKINEAIPLSSSSPAFFFRMLKAMAEVGEKNGISYEDSFKLAATAMMGSAEYAMKSEASLDELISQVSSPGGTTVAALSAFDDFGFEKFIEEVEKRCINRAYELGTSK